MFQYHLVSSHFLSVRLVAVGSFTDPPRREEISNCYDFTEKHSLLNGPVFLLAQCFLDVRFSGPISIADSVLNTLVSLLNPNLVKHATKSWLVFHRVHCTEIGCILQITVNRFQFSIPTFKTQQNPWTCGV